MMFVGWLEIHDYVPRWEKGKERVKCCIKDCTEVSKYVFNIATVEKLLPIFEENNLEGDTPLCKCHYHTVYFSVQPQQTTVTAPPVGCPLSM